MQMFHAPESLPWSPKKELITIKMIQDWLETFCNNPNILFIHCIQELAPDAESKNLYFSLA